MRKTEILVKVDQSRKGGALQKRVPKVADKDVNIVALEKDLSKILGLKVDIEFDMGGGSIKIAYKSLEQLDAVLYLLSEGAHGKACSPEDG